MILRFIILFILLCLCLNFVCCAKILGIFTVPSISHQAVFQAIWKELSLRGHEVTVITPNPLNDKSLENLTEIDVSFSYKTYKKVNLQHSMDKALSARDVVKNIYNLLSTVLEEQLSDPEVQNLIKSKKHFDLVMVEYFNPATFAFSALYDCPLIGATSLGAPLTGHDAVGNPTHPVLNPDTIFLPFADELSLFDRIQSLLHSIWYRYYHHYHLLPQQDKIAKKHLGKDLPYIGDIEKNISMLFINENPFIHPIRSNVPAVIQLGSTHIKKPKPLPKDLQKELDAATKGVVYFSLGTNVRSAGLSEDIRQKIIGALSEIPYKVLWKWEDKYLPGQPKNVIIRQWLPQQDVLGHPNIKVFVTQGGLQSIEESVSKGVPLVGIPFIADQPLNVKKMVNLGMAQAVDIETLTKEKLKAAIIEVAENPKYLNRAKELSQLIADVPMTGLEKAIWWTEYVIRHKGVRHLRSPAVHLPLYQYLLLDVIGFLFAIVIVSILVMYVFVKLSMRIVENLFKTSKLKVY